MCKEKSEKEIDNRGGVCGVTGLLPPPDPECCPFLVNVKTYEKYQELLEAAQCLVRALKRTKYDSDYREWEYTVEASRHDPIQRLCDAAKALVADNPDKAKG